MPSRKSVGEENLVGQTVVRLRKERHMNQKTLLAQLQVRGIDLNQSALSELEGQKRKVSDRELLALGEIFEVTLDELIKSEK